MVEFTDEFSSFWHHFKTGDILYASKEPTGKSPYKTTYYPAIGFTSNELIKKCGFTQEQIDDLNKIKPLDSKSIPSVQDYVGKYNGKYYFLLLRRIDHSLYIPKTYNSDFKILKSRLDEK